MSHVIIIIGRNIDCVAKAFPVLETVLNALKSKIDEAETFLAQSTEENEPLHELLHNIEERTGEWCDNPESFESEDIESDCEDFIADLDELLP